MHDQPNVNRRCCAACDNGGAPADLAEGCRAGDGGTGDHATTRHFDDQPPADLDRVVDWAGAVYTRRRFLPWDGAWYDADGNRFTWQQLLAMPYGVTERREAP